MVVNNKFRDFEEWWQHGYKQGWCGPPVCEIHDGLPTTEEEDEAFSDGYDPCIHILRLYEDVEIKESVEGNHSPSTWRATNRMGNANRPTDALE